MIHTRMYQHMPPPSPALLLASSGCSPSPFSHIFPHKTDHNTYLQQVKKKRIFGRKIRKEQPPKLNNDHSKEYTIDKEKLIPWKEYSYQLLKLYHQFILLKQHKGAQRNRKSIIPISPQTFFSLQYIP